MLSTLRGLSVRRPFSRKIKISPQALANPPDRERELSRLRGLVAADPLFAGLHLLFQVFDGKLSEAHAGLDRFAGRWNDESIAWLTGRTDFRKFFIAGLRLAASGQAPLAPDQAGLLLDFAFRFDKRLTGIGAPEPEQAAPALLHFDATPPGGAMPKTVFYARRHFFGQTSRPHDFGPRMKTAFAAAGADLVLTDPNLDGAEAIPCDLALLDDTALFAKDPAKKQDFLERVRKVSGKVCLLEPDPWMTHFPKRVADNAALYDFIWSMAPSMAEAGSLNKPFCLIPFPVGFGGIFDRLEQGPAPVPGASFCGAIEDYNFHRYYWFLANAKAGSPMDFVWTSHAAAGGGVEAEIEDYLRRLLRTEGCVSFSMRADGRRVVVGRSFDAIRAGRLLLQEACREFEYYFAPGSHFLKFDSMDELAELADGLRHGSAHRDIARAGRDYFDRHYSDAAIARHLASWA
jgi:hypothetical protein